MVPFYPVAARLQKSTTENSVGISSRIQHKIRRIPDANFKTKKFTRRCLHRFFLFESTDLYIQTALQRGGNECHYQVLIAKQELGTLRDGRFIINATKSKNFEHRQIAVARIAFLQSEFSAMGNLAPEQTSEFDRSSDFKNLFEQTK